MCYRPLALRFWRYFSTCGCPWAPDVTMMIVIDPWVVGLLVISLAGKDSALPGRARHLLNTAAEAGRRRQSYSQLEKITASGASAAFGAAVASCAFLSGSVVALSAARPKFGSFAMVRVGARDATLTCAGLVRGMCMPRGSGP